MMETTTKRQELLKAIYQRLEQAREILRLALTDNQEHPLNIVTRIEQRFADLGDFEVPEILREPIRNVRRKSHLATISKI